MHEILGFAADPFIPHKRDALESATDSFVATVLPLAGTGKSDTWEQSVRAAILRSLWGNRADLSLSGGAVDASHFDAPAGHGGKHEASASASGSESSGSGPGSGQDAPAIDPTGHSTIPLTEAGGMLRDDSAAMAGFLAGRARAGAGSEAEGERAPEKCKAAEVEVGANARVTIVLDNCGLELLCDLVLVDALLAPRSSPPSSSTDADAAGSGASELGGVAHVSDPEIAKSPVRHVELVAKTDPVFVSDATVLDVEQHLLFLEALAGVSKGKGEDASGAAPGSTTDAGSRAGSGRPPSNAGAWDVEGLARRCSGKVSEGQRAAIGELVGRLRAALVDGRLTVRQDDFFNSPLPMDKAPARVYSDLFLGGARPSDRPAAAGGDAAEHGHGGMKSAAAGSSSEDASVKAHAASGATGTNRLDRALVLFKGDANYRRLLGDRHWAHDTTLEEAWGAYWGPAAEAVRGQVGSGAGSKGGFMPRVAVGALRTAKAGVLAGVDAGKAAEAAALRPGTWLVEGRFAVA